MTLPCLAALTCWELLPLLDPPLLPLPPPLLLPLPPLSLSQSPFQPLWIHLLLSLSLMTCSCGINSVKSQRAKV